MQFIKLTSTDGQPIWISAAMITAVYLETVDSDITCVATLGHETYFVKESPEEVLSKITLPVNLT